MKKIIIMPFFFILITVNIQAADLDDVYIHGFISQGYMNSDHNNFLADTEEGTFEFNELGINFNKRLSPKLRVGLQFFARDIGEEGNDEVMLDWAYADYKWKKWLGLRVGKIKMIGGIYSEIRDVDMLRTSAFLPFSVYPELFRNSNSAIKGLGVYGEIPMNIAGSFVYNSQVGNFMMSAGSGTANAFRQNAYLITGNDVSTDTIDHNYAYSFGGKWNTPLKGLKIGSSYYSISDLQIDGEIINLGYPYSYQNDTFGGYYYSVEFLRNDFYFVYEFSHMDAKGTTTSRDYPDFINKSDEPTEGWYLSCSYWITEWFELGGGYSEYFPRSKDKNGNLMPEGLSFLSWLKNYTLSTRFDIIDNWIVKFEYHHMDGFGVFNSVENDYSDLKRNWNLFVVKLTFSF